MSLGLAAAPDDLFDVTAVRFEVTPLGDEGPPQVRVVPLEHEGLPAAVDPALAGRPFADWYVVLEPGPYRVRATPLSAEGAVSRVCAGAEEETMVFPGVTTELLLVSECRGGENGGLDTSLTFNARPYIEELSFRDSKFACSSHAAVMSLQAQDPDGDALTYEWSVVGLPEGADHSSYCLIAQGHFASFAAVVEGRYDLQVTASDGSQSASLRFPIYISHCEFRPNCPGDIAAPVDPDEPSVAAGRCACDELGLDPNWGFDPATEWPDAPPVGPAEEVPACALDQLAIFAEVDNDNDGNDDIVGFQVLDVGDACEQTYCVEQDGTFVPVEGAPFVDPALPIPLAATSLGCEGAPPMPVCPVLSDGTQAQDCGGIPPLDDCMTITMCPDPGAWADPNDPSVVDETSATDHDEPILNAMGLNLDPAQLVYLDPCDWEHFTGVEFDAPIVDPDAQNNDLMASISKGSDKWKVDFQAGIERGRAHTRGIFHHSLEYDLETHSVIDLRLRILGGELRDVLSVDAHSAVSECSFTTRYDTRVAGDSVDLAGMMRLQDGGELVAAQVGDIDEASTPVAEAVCEMRLAALHSAERFVNERLHDALIAWAFFNLAGPTGAVVDSEEAAQGFIDLYEDAVVAYQGAVDAFHGAQTNATEHSFAGLIAQTDLQFQLGQPVRTGINIGPFSVSIEANAVGKVGLAADLETGIRNEAHCEGVPCVKMRTKTTITPRASVGGYLFFSASISLGKFAGVEAGIRGELDFATFQLPIVADFGLERTIQPLAPAELPGDLGDMLSGETLVQPSAASFRVPYTYGANLLGHFLGGRIKLVVRAWLLWIDREWSKTIASWDGILKTWQIGEPGGGDALEAFGDDVDLGAVPDMVSLPVLVLQAPAVPLPADVVEPLIYTGLEGVGHHEADLGTPWGDDGHRCFPPVP